MFILFQKEQASVLDGLNAMQSLKISWCWALACSFWKGRKPQAEIDAHTVPSSGFSSQQIPKRLVVCCTK